MILLYSLDVRAGRSYHSICPDHRFGIDHQRFLEEICGSRPLADCQEGHPERISGKDSSSFASIGEIIFFILIIFAFFLPEEMVPGAVRLAVYEHRHIDRVENPDRAFGVRVRPRRGSHHVSGHAARVLQGHEGPQ